MNKTSPGEPNNELIPIKSPLEKVGRINKPYLSFPIHIRNWNAKYVQVEVFPFSFPFWLYASLFPLVAFLPQKKAALKKAAGLLLKAFVTLKLLMKSAWKDGSN